VSVNSGSMDDENEITKADLNAARADLKLDLTNTLASTRDDLKERLCQMEAKLIAAFRSYD
jgi:hypothetical protein